MPKLDTAEPNTGLRERPRERLEKQRHFNGVSPVQERPDAPFRATRRLANLSSCSTQ